VASDVFISYSVKDKPVVDAVVARLEAESVRCWVAPRDVIPGADWGKSIINAIESSPIMLLLLSRSANESPQIKEEVEWAVNNRVRIIAFRVDDIPPARTLVYFIASQWIDAFSPPLERHLDNLAKTIKAVLAFERVSGGLLMSVGPPRSPPEKAGMEFGPPRPPRSPAEQAEIDRQVEIDRLAAIAKLRSAIKVIRRTPHMQVSPSGPFTVGEKFKVSVFVDQFAAREGEKAVDLEIPTQEGVNDYEISVWLIGTGHFTISLPALQTFVIHRGVPRSDSVTFEVTVSDATLNGTPRIMALFRHNERACGEVSRKINLRGPSTTEDKPPPALFSVHTTAEPAHLTIEITNPSKDLQHFDCLVSTSLLSSYKSGKTEAWNLNERTETLVEQYFREFTARGTAPAARIAALRGAGKKLFERAPQIFRDAYWRIVDEKKPLQTISIVSQDPFIPWELMIPHRDLPDGSFEIRKPLGVEFRIGRWTKKQHFAAPQTLPLNDGWVFAPNYRDPPPPQPLKWADDEAKLVMDAFHGERISPASTAKFIQTIKNDCRSFLHFICHGSSRLAGSQTILDEDKAVLTSLQLAGYEIDNACAKKKPFVFLNACEVGRPIPSLTGLGGFASEFVDLGASAVIAPLWSVKDDIAHEVAEEFYGAIKADPRIPFAEVIRKIRKRAYDDPAGEDTYAAYCFYGDPLAEKTPSYSDRKFTCPQPQCSKIMILTPEEYAKKRYRCPYCQTSGII